MHILLDNYFISKGTSGTNAYIQLSVLKPETTSGHWKASDLPHFDSFVNKVVANRASLEGAFVEDRVSHASQCAETATTTTAG